MFHSYLDEGDPIKTLVVIRNLNHITRFNVRMRLHDENVASHSLFTGFIAYYLADRVREKGLDVDPSKALILGCIHDLEECVLGDVLLPTKHSGLVDRYRDLEVEVKGKILRSLGINIDFSDLERKIVKVADYLEGYLYCIEEVDLGNRFFEDIMSKYKERLEGYVARELDGIIGISDIRWLMDRFWEVSKKRFNNG